MKVRNFVGFSLKMLRCRVRALPVEYGYSLSVPLRGDVQRGQSSANGAYTCGISVVLLARLGLLYSRKPTALAGAERVSAKRGARAY